jgi:hypothetical protein
MKHDKPAVDKKGFGVAKFADRHDVGISFIKRAISWGKLKVIYYGDRPIVPVDEDERVGREGLPDVPPGYRRKTDGPLPPRIGRPRKTPTRRRKAKGADREARP